MNTRISTELNEFAYYHMSLLWYLSEISDKAGKEALERVRIGYPGDGQTSKKALMRAWAVEYIFGGRKDEALYGVLDLLVGVTTSVRLQNLRTHVWTVSKTGYPVNEWGIWEIEITWDASEYQVLT